MAVIHSKAIQDRVIIQSFDFRTLQVLHTKYPTIKTAALVADTRGLDEHLKQLGFTPTIYSPLYTLVKPELIEQCHQQKIKVLPWTVNDKPTIEKLKSMGVDGIITDYPNLF
ncbi:glycerophosphodiester phosphodiesterase family protein [Paraflavitalea speifideaquila]|uniref:glycerophosphodiester phosphodiesterase family protein n=1 Tax=Paraflavitalea speifideaquila TaxID=3076558 RepID=UPI0028EDC51A|nr:glycerophosphodiester phosphodiesterase family protein [Paraflavitalea speifideiaquila]